MGNLLSTKPKLEITDADRAVLTLKSQRRRLEDQRTWALTQLGREAEVARQLVAAGRRDRALLALKKRRLQQLQLEKLDAWVLHVEGMLANVETAANQVRMLAALKRGNEALQRMQKAVSLENVEQLAQDTAEAYAYQEQLQQMLGESWTGQDEAAAEAALACLEGELAQDEASTLPAVPRQPVPKRAVAAAGSDDIESLPAVPTHVPVIAPPSKPGERLLAS